VFLVCCASLLIALSGRVAIPLPFTPVPIALQPHMCLLMGALLGRRQAVAAVALFLGLGACGLPVFSQGLGGFAMFLGPRGGYLMGYLAAVWVVGFLIEKKQLFSPRQKTLAMGLGNLVIYACALPQLSLFIGVERVFLLGMAPFLVGDLIKLFAAYRLLKDTIPQYNTNPLG
jgi:biotin transport system substrate-specific component